MYIYIYTYHNLMEFWVTINSCYTGPEDVVKGEEDSVICDLDYTYTYAFAAVVAIAAIVVYFGSR